MSKFLKRVVCIGSLLSMLAGCTTKVILDCDMSYVNDDAFAMMFLAQADKLGYIDLLGVAVSGGNKTGAVAVNVVLLQLEAVGRTDIPVMCTATWTSMFLRKTISKSVLRECFPEANDLY